MIQGMEILLDRMKTHPEEFLRDYSGLPNKWDRLIDHYRHVLTDAEMKAYNNAKHELERQKFTSNVLEILLAEPVQLAPETITFSTQGRDPWGSTTLQIQEQVLADKQKMFEELYRDEINKLKAQNQVTKTKAEKNKTKMQQLLQNVTKKRQVY
jgi:uncharacterized protein YeaO (DUF488 family)